MLVELKAADLDHTVSARIEDEPAGRRVAHGDIDRRTPRVVGRVPTAANFANAKQAGSSQGAKKLGIGILHPREHPLQNVEERADTGCTERPEVARLKQMLHLLARVVVLAVGAQRSARLPEHALHGRHLGGVATRVDFGPFGRGNAPAVVFQLSPPRLPQDEPSLTSNR
jgi:hypothetical protein